ncbi:Ankyrin repeat domain-containing protein 40 [Dispira simplex]|nr:Ankyrin repeat domain-containing protein 40 [Dispira simplex]
MCEYTQLEEQLREYSALGNARAVRLLLNAGVDVNSTNAVNGWTALHWACRRNQPIIVDILLNVGGADPTVRNRNGQVARDLTSDGVIRQMLDDYAEKHPTSDSATIQAVNPNTAQSTDPNRTHVAQNGPESSSATFVPSYLRYPEADKLWELPADIKPTTQSLTYQDVQPVRPNLDVGVTTSRKVAADMAMAKFAMPQSDIHTERAALVPVVFHFIRLLGCLEGGNEATFHYIGF